MKAKIIYKSNLTADSDYELLFDVISDDETQVIYPGVRIYCNTKDDVVARIQARIQDIQEAQKSIDELPEVIELPDENGDIS